MAQVKLSATELLSICTLIEDVSRQGSKETDAGLYIDFMYISSIQCKMLADILQHISTEMYGFTNRERELCKKLRDAAN